MHSIQTFLSYLGLAHLKIATVQLFTENPSLVREYAECINNSLETVYHFSFVPSDIS